MTELTRRRALRSSGAVLAGAFLAGCLADEPGADDGTDTDRDTDDDSTDPDGNETDHDDENGGANPPNAVQPRTDEPPYEIEVPECGEGGRDSLYLCANLDAEPSLEFEQETTTLELFADEGLTLEREPQASSEFYAALVTSEADLDRLADQESDVITLIADTDFDDSAVLIVQTGWGSGSIVPHLTRIEETDDGIHAYGCQSDPCGGDGDYTHRSVVARFDRPETVEEAIVSLTLDPETRFHVAASERVVSLE